MRPAIRQCVKFKLFDHPEYYTGRIKKVGKSSGKEKYTCWIEDNVGNEYKINFSTDIEDWQYIKKVQFDQETEDKTKENEEDVTNDLVKENASYYTELKLDTIGAQELKEIRNVFSVLIPKKDMESLK